MRNSVRLAGIAATAAALLAMGSPAFAADKEDPAKDGSSVTTAGSQGGAGGSGGNGGLGVNVCPSIGILGSAEAKCSAADGGSADGGEATADATDDSKEEAKGKDG